MTVIVLFGKNGQVGHGLTHRLAGCGELTALDAADVDLTQPGRIRESLRAVRPQLIVNAAAYTAVDQAEDEPDVAAAVNAVAPAVMAEEARALGAALIHYSTDYVFDGTKSVPYTEEDAPAPLGVYGRSKLAGDQAVAAAGAPHLIFRTQWVYGTRGRNFLLTMQRLLAERDELGIVDDQVGAPTWCEAIAEATVRIIAQGGADPVSHVARHAGLYNMSCAGSTSWYGFTEAIRRHMQQQSAQLAQLKAIRTSDYPTRAARPAYTVLDNGRLRSVFGVELPDWREALAAALSSD